eukprot:6184413-Pleurochrysis_carterae.AAC.2
MPAAWRIHLPPPPPLSPLGALAKSMSQRYSSFDLQSALLVISTVALLTALLMLVVHNLLNDRSRPHDARQQSKPLNGTSHQRYLSMQTEEKLVVAAPLGNLRSSLQVEDPWYYLQRACFSRECTWQHMALSTFFEYVLTVSVNTL